MGQLAGMMSVWGLSLDWAGASWSSSGRWWGDEVDPTTAKQLDTELFAASPDGW